MSCIGGVEFKVLKDVGKVPDVQPVLEEISQPGVDGKSFAVIGWRGERAVVRGLLLVNSAADVVVAHAALTALCATVVSVTDDFGLTGTGILVHSWKEVQRNQYLGSTSGAWGGIWVEVVVEAL